MPANIPPVTLVGDTTYDKIGNYFSEQGCNDATVAGMLACIYDSSGGNPEAVGDGGYSFGIIQWNKERLDAYNDYCNSNGYDAKRLESQLYYLSDVYLAENDCTDFFENASDDVNGAKEVAKYWTSHGLQPKELGIAQANRQHAASWIYNLMHSNPTMTYGEAFEQYKAYMDSKKERWN